MIRNFVKYSSFTAVLLFGFACTDNTTQKQAKPPVLSQPGTPEKPGPVNPTKPPVLSQPGIPETPRPVNPTKPPVPSQPGIPEKPKPDNQGPIAPPSASLLASAPSYCHAQVAKEQVAAINAFVANAYNRHMKGIPGFKPAVASASSTQPSVTFAAPGHPGFYYPKNGLKFHSTICNQPNSTFFRCDDAGLLGDVSKTSTSNHPVSEYIKYFKPRFLGSDFSFSAPEEFGPLFVALPLAPAEIRDNNGNVISGLLHVSIAKIYTSNQGSPETQASRDLKAQFVSALKSEFPSLQSQLAKINFAKINCQP